MDCFNPMYSFDSFVVGEGNEYAYKAAQIITETPGTIYNPLFIYGKTGTGKTHLLNAIGVYLEMNKPQMKVKYLTLEQFTEELIKSYSNDTVETFRGYYSTLDILLIDDAQYVSGKEKTQDELVQLLDSRYENKKQTVLASCMIYDKLPDLKERLRSRFVRGLVIDISIQDYEVKKSIAKQIGIRNGVSINFGLLRYTDNVEEQNGFDLEGIVKKAKFYSGLIYKSKCIVCGSEIEIKKGKMCLCSKCQERRDVDDTSSECKQCQDRWNSPFE